MVDRYSRANLEASPPPAPCRWSEWLSVASRRGGQSFRPSAQGRWSDASSRQPGVAANRLSTGTGPAEQCGPTTPNENHLKSHRCFPEITRVLRSPAGRRRLPQGGRRNAHIPGAVGSRLFGRRRSEQATRESSYLVENTPQSTCGGGNPWHNGRMRPPRRCQSPFTHESRYLRAQPWRAFASDTSTTHPHHLHALCAGDRLRTEAVHEDEHRLLPVGPLDSGMDRRAGVRLGQPRRERGDRHGGVRARSTV